MLKKLHHVAYRCNDAQETVDFYTKVLGLKFAKGIIQDLVPSIQKVEPHIHIFFEMFDGSFIAFFDIAEETMDVDDLKKDWAQHLALEIAPEQVEGFLASLKKHSVDFVGPIGHGICESYYFYDPNGHRLEAAVRTDSAEIWQTAAQEAYPILEEWNKTKAAM